MINLSHVRKTYQLTKTQSIDVLQDVSLTIEKNEFVSIMGPSGSGKSTLMNIIGMLDLPSKGTYKLHEKFVHDLSLSEQDNIRGGAIGFVFQGYNLIKRMSVLDQVMLPLTYQGHYPRTAKKRALAALERVGLADKQKSMPNELSGGQQQRVAIARALVIDPLLLLCDEPTGALDSKTGSEVLCLFGSLHKQGSTIIMITHDPEVAKHGQRIINLKDGKIV